MGDGMQCPPSPLLFDPSLTLEDHLVKEIAEDPVDILASEEQSHLFPACRDLARQRVPCWIACTPGGEWGVITSIKTLHMSLAH